MDITCKEDNGWDKKCSLLKRKCEEYEEMNDILLTRTKRLHRMIQRAEKGKCSLVRRLKQFEVLDEAARFKLAQVLGTVPQQENERTLLAAAVKIRAELDAELEHMKVAVVDSRVNERESRSTVSNTYITYYDQGHSHANCTAETYDFRSPASAPSQSNTSNTPQQSPLASVIVTPTNLVQASVPTLGTGSSLTGSSKANKGLKSSSKVSLNVADKQKTQTRGFSSTKKKKTDADPNAPKKPSNAFFWFCQEKRASLQEQFRAEGVSGQHDLTKALARHWSETNTEDKKGEETVKKAMISPGISADWQAFRQFMTEQPKDNMKSGGSGSCTDGFPTLQQLLSTTDTTPARQIPLQGLFPALRVTCDGHLMEIIYIASRGGLSGSEYFNVWREDGPGSNVYIMSSAISSSSETLLSIVDESIGLYSIRLSNFSVRARDFIGFTAYQPTKLQFLYLNNAAPGSLYTSIFWDSIDLNAVTNYDQNYLPLITVVIAPHSPTPSPVTFTMAVTYGDSANINITAIYIVSSGVVALLVVSLAIICVARAISRMKKERRNPRQHSRSEQFCTEVANSHGRASKEEGSSDGDNCSMECNPNYGGHSIEGHIELDQSTSNENMYHTLEFEHQPAGRQWQQQHAINADSNYYHTLQHLDHKSKYEAESEYCVLAYGLPELEGRSGCSDATTLEQATVKSGTDMADVENGYDSLNAGHNHTEHCSAIVVKPNMSYGLPKTSTISPAFT